MAAAVPDSSARRNSSQISGHNDEIPSPGTDTDAAATEIAMTCETNIKSAGDIPGYSEVVGATNCTSETGGQNLVFSDIDHAATNAQIGIDIAMSYEHETPTAANVATVGVPASIGPSTIELKNRKKRKAADAGEVGPFVVKVEEFVQAFYCRYLEKKAIQYGKTTILPPFVRVRVIEITYKEFFESLHVRCGISDKVMALYLHVFNDEPAKYMFHADDRRKISTSPFTKKLLVNPKMFQTRCCIGELRKCNEILTMTTADLIYFPVIIQDHWVVMCVNVLCKTLNFFDPSNQTKGEDSERMLRNLASNFTKACHEANQFPDGFSNYSSFSPTYYPQPYHPHHFGFYCILYMDCWNGMNMTDFQEEAATEYRKVVAYKIFNSPLNELCLEKHDAKRKHVRRN